MVRIWNEGRQWKETFPSCIYYYKYVYLIYARGNTHERETGMIMWAVSCSVKDRFPLLMSTPRMYFAHTNDSILCSISIHGTALGSKWSRWEYVLFAKRESNRQSNAFIWWVQLHQHSLAEFQTCLEISCVECLRFGQCVVSIGYVSELDTTHDERRSDPTSA